MSDHKRSFAFYKDCTNDLYSQVNLVLELEEGDPKQVKTLIIDANCVYTELEHAMLQEENEVCRKFGFHPITTRTWSWVWWNGFQLAVK